MSARNRAAGFTLVELLVAATVASLLAVLLFDSLHVAADSSRAVERRTDRTATIALVDDFLRRGLVAAIPYPAIGGTARPPVDFTGTPESLAFVAGPPAHMALGGLHHVVINRVSGRLVVAWDQLLRAGAGSPVPSVLAENVKSADFAYFGIQSPDRPMAWSGSWAGRRTLPQLVRLRLTFEDGVAAPDIVVSLALAGPPQP